MSISRERIQYPREYGNLIITWNIDPAIERILLGFNQEKFVQENPEIKNAGRTGYPLLFALQRWLFLEKMEGKKIVEIGGGGFASDNVAYLRRLTDAPRPNGEIIHTAFGIVNRTSRQVISWNGVLELDWENIDSIFSELDCVFNHRIGPNSGNYSQVTDNCLKHGWFYIAFRNVDSTSPEPINKKFFLDKGYHDGSFVFHFKDPHFRHNSGKILKMEDRWYEVTILRKPFKSTNIIRGTQDDTGVILAG